MMRASYILMMLYTNRFYLFNAALFCPRTCPRPQTLSLASKIRPCNRPRPQRIVIGLDFGLENLSSLNITGNKRTRMTASVSSSELVGQENKNKSVVIKPRTSLLSTQKSVINRKIFLKVCGFFIVF